MKTIGLALAALTLALLGVTSCGPRYHETDLLEVESGVYGSDYDDGGVYYVKTAPPPPPKRVKVVVKRRPGYVWVPGHWRWHRGDQRHIWQPGHFVKAQPGKDYVAPRWQQTPEGWIFIKAQWK